MIDFEQLLNNYIAVEQSGQFNPYKQVYSASFERNDADVPPVQDDGKKQASVNVQTYPNTLNVEPEITGVDITSRFTNRGYNDPFKDIVTDGTIDFSVMTTGYNQLGADPEIGLSQRQYVDYLNKTYKPELEKTYYPGAELEIGEDGVLRLSKTKEEDEELKTRFEKVWGKKEDGKSGWKYLEVYEDPEVARKMKKAAKEYETEEEYDIARGVKKQ